MPRGTSAALDDVMETMTTGASWPWNLSTVPTLSRSARLVELLADECDLGVVGGDHERICLCHCAAALHSADAATISPWSDSTSRTTSAASSGEATSRPLCSTGIGCSPGATPAEIAESVSGSSDYRRPA